MPVQAGDLDSGESAPGSSCWKTFAVVNAAGVVAKPELIQYTWGPLELSNALHFKYLLCFALFP